MLTAPTVPFTLSAFLTVSGARSYLPSLFEFSSLQVLLLYSPVFVLPLLAAFAHVMYSGPAADALLTATAPSATSARTHAPTVLMRLILPPLPSGFAAR